ncbi:MAG: S-layer homology domain-containing protein [Clostridiales bacterium]|nr:S-layer homology domain-containing protein [Clostridiales bacterium]
MKYYKYVISLAMAATVAAGLIGAAASSVSAAGEVKIDKTNFPDEVFRKYVSENIDKDKNGSLSEEEISRVDSIQIRTDIKKNDDGSMKLDDKGKVIFDGKTVKSLKGVEFFTNLNRLDCAYNEITELDVSKNTYLTSLNCAINKLKSLDVSKNTGLEDLECMTNEITKLDISKNKDLVFLSCGYNPITKLDLSNNKKLKNVLINETKLSSLDVTMLKDLDCLWCNEIGLKALDVSKNPKLTVLYCEKNKLTKLDLSKNKKLNNLDCANNNLKSIDLKDLPDLERAYIDHNDFKELEIRNCAKLSALFLYRNFKLTKLSVIDLPKLKDLNTQGCKISKLTISGCSSLKGFAASATYLKEADVALYAGDKMHPSFPIFKDEDSDDPVPGSNSFFAFATTVNSDIATIDWVKDLFTIVGKQPGTEIAEYTYCDVKDLDDGNAADPSARDPLYGGDPGPFIQMYPQYTHKIKIKVTVMYKDVSDAGEFWYKPTYALSTKGVVKGYDKQTKFKPANDCTRAQMVTFLWRLAGSPAPKADSCKFGDVKKSDYYYKAVIWAVENGITTGVSKTKFNPSGVCTRAQTVTFLWRMAGKPSVGSAKNPFSDVKSKDYFYNAVIWASDKKIVAGYKDGTFKPSEKCLRRQMVTFLYKYDKNVNAK